MSIKKGKKWGCIVSEIRIVKRSAIETEDDLIQAIISQPEMMDDLEVVASLGLPYACIAAGYFRNFVWDVLHGYEVRTPNHDVDVLYYDSTCMDEEMEKEYDARLQQMNPNRQWSVKNQARMHIKSGRSPFQSVEEAMLHWPETATAIGARLMNNGSGCIELVTPFGLDDLLSLRIVQSPYCNDQQLFMQRIENKKWLRHWPQLKVELEQEK